jgi:hypothetical protein
MPEIKQTIKIDTTEALEQLNELIERAEYLAKLMDGLGIKRDGTQ